MKKHQSFVLCKLKDKNGKNTKNPNRDFRL